MSVSNFPDFLFVLSNYQKMVYNHMNQRKNFRYEDIEKNIFDWNIERNKAFARCDFDLVCYVVEITVLKKIT